jgi:hypothetical protein
MVIETSERCVTESYIVRIYRRSGKDSHALVGSVEDAGSGANQVFHTLSELCAILTASADNAAADGGIRPVYVRSGLKTDCS